MNLFSLILCCSWQAATRGSWLCISLAWDVWLSKRDYLTGLLPPASWHCRPAAALHTKEKRRGNTRQEIKFCAAWAWLREHWESHEGGGDVLSQVAECMEKQRLGQLLQHRQVQLGCVLHALSLSLVLEERRSLWCCFGLSWLEQNVLKRDYSWQIKCCICFLVQRWLGVLYSVAFLHACTLFQWILLLWSWENAHLLWKKLCSYSS